MPQVVSFRAPRDVALVDCEEQPLQPGSVRVRTWYSGISAGTELTAYRGSNPYLTGTWDPGRRLFVTGTPTHRYPVIGWGYSEVGAVVETADDVDPAAGPRPGEVVYGIWGHRSDAVLPAASVSGRTLPAGADPLQGVFARVGAIALNAVLAADARLGDRVVVFGQGVIGLLATRLAVLAGTEVAAVDAHPDRLEAARAMGAAETIPAGVDGGAGAAVRAWTGGGADSAIELSGSYHALHEATRAVVVDGTVVASGFYQGGAEPLRLGEEFHHNRVELVSSQIANVPARLAHRWTPLRLERTILDLHAAGRLELASLVSHVIPAVDVDDAFRLLDERPDEPVQVVLDFR